MAKKTKTKTRVKANVKKKKGRGRKKKSQIIKQDTMDIDVVYSTINQAQISKKEQKLCIANIDQHVIENILKDCDITFQKSDKNDHIIYVIFPPAETEMPEEDFDFDEEYDDELQDDEQCF